MRESLQGTPSWKLGEVPRGHERALRSWVDRVDGVFLTRFVFSFAALERKRILSQKLRSASFFPPLHFFYYPVSLFLSLSLLPRRPALHRYRDMASSLTTTQGSLVSSSSSSTNAAARTARRPLSLSKAMKKAGSVAVAATGNGGGASSSDTPLSLATSILHPEKCFIDPYTALSTPLYQVRRVSSCTNKKLIVSDGNAKLLQLKTQPPLFLLLLLFSKLSRLPPSASPRPSTWAPTTTPARETPRERSWSRRSPRWRASRG